VEGLLASLTTIALALALSGCATMEYLAQAACGQADIGLRARKLEGVRSDPNTSPEVRALLAEVPAIKMFAERQGLKATSNYGRYADVERSAVVWVVSASAPLSFTPHTWTFPIVGSVPYLGWFDRGDARDLAEYLRATGYDVDVRGAAAYSTLGWFNDPILSTMLGRGNGAIGDLANVVLHESVHATFYVRGQSALNESVAGFLGDRLAAAYLLETTGEDSEELRAYLEGLRSHERRAGTLHAAHEELAALYASSLSREAKLASKARILNRLRSDLGFPGSINNATLQGSEVYNSGRAELTELYDASGHDAARLLAALRELGPASFSRPHEQDLARVLAPLVRRVRAAGIARPGKASITARR
jgi:predicted aminopeptidase